MATVGLTLSIVALAITTAATTGYLLNDRRRRREMARLRAQVEAATTAEQIIARAVDGTTDPDPDERPHLRLIQGGGAGAVAAPLAAAVWLWHHLRSHTVAPTTGLAAVAVAAFALPASDPASHSLTPPVIARPPTTAPAVPEATPTPPHPAPPPQPRPAPAPTPTVTESTPPPMTPAPPPASPSAPPTTPPADEGDPDDDQDLCLKVRLGGLETAVCVGGRPPPANP